MTPWRPGASAPPPAAVPSGGRGYPRPQLHRDPWHSLNGEWEFAFDDADEGLHRGWHDERHLAQRIAVPFPYQSSRSGSGISARRRLREKRSCCNHTDETCDDRKCDSPHDVTSFQATHLSHGV